MDISNMKNIVILKNLPSNLVEEAFVILKANKKIKKPEYIENVQENFKNSKGTNDLKNEDNYIVKEAEFVVSNYISKMENENIKGKGEFYKLERKYNKLKFCTILISIIMFVSFIFNIF